jgi:uncharacterized protein YcbK (DUF882 family)
MYKEEQQLQEQNSSFSERTITRRGFLKTCGFVVANVVVPTAFAKITLPNERKLNFYHLHTGEKLTATYWADGNYVADELKQINYLLRDFRSEEVFPIDRNLLDLLYVLKQNVDRGRAFHIISGYRSPATNAMLRKKSKGVARRSLHMRGMAIDIRLPGCDLTTLRRAALSMKKGGVGYYPKSNFIHVDVGRVRTWKG